jgi:predicted RNase H-like HicB family nuclease
MATFGKETRSGIRRPGSSTDTGGRPRHGQRVCEIVYTLFVPDLPGCVAAAENLEEVRQLIAEAIAFHIEGMREEGLAVPRPTSICESVEVEV